MNDPIKKILLAGLDLLDKEKAAEERQKRELFENQRPGEFKSVLYESWQMAKEERIEINKIRERLDLIWKD